MSVGEKGKGITMVYGWHGVTKGGGGVGLDKGI